MDQLLRHVACDRCGTAWTGPFSTQPEGWVGVIIPTSPLGQVDPKHHYHLCADCDIDFNRFLNNWEVKRRA